jgi:hypothetical protein
MLVMLIPATWLQYLAIMALAAAERNGRMTAWARRFGMVLLGIGYLSDFLLNVTVGTVLFLELPREWLLSPRVARLQKGQGYRATVAGWVCKNLLDPFDPSGCHCK